jgi:hypothetical protein
MWPFGRGELIERVGASESAAHESDEQAILDMLVPRAQARIDGTAAGRRSLDTKALGVLGVDTAAVALLVAVRDSLNALWWIPTGALGVTRVLLLAAIWPRTFDLGPDPRKFYEAMGGSTRVTATRQMLSELLEAVDYHSSDGSESEARAEPLSFAASEASASEGSARLRGERAGDREGREALAFPRANEGLPAISITAAATVTVCAKVPPIAERSPASAARKR